MENLKYEEPGSPSGSVQTGGKTNQPGVGWEAFIKSHGALADGRKGRKL